MPVYFKVFGKQPDSDVWVFNDEVHMDKDGMRIRKEDMSFLLTDNKLPALDNISAGIFLFLTTSLQ